MKPRKELADQTRRDSQTAIALREHAGLRVQKKNQLKTFGQLPVNRQWAQRERKLLLKNASQCAHSVASPKDQLKTTPRLEDIDCHPPTQTSNPTRWPSRNCDMDRQKIAPLPSATAPATTKLKLPSPDP
jgi:hypothetical protein